MLRFQMDTKADASSYVWCLLSLAKMLKKDGYSADDLEQVEICIGATRKDGKKYASNWPVNKEDVALVDKEHPDVGWLD